MTATQAKAIETIRRQLRTLHAIARNTEDWQDAEAIHATADEIAAQLEAIELDATPACEDHAALDLAA